MRAYRPLLTSAMLAVGLTLAACQSPITAPSIGASQSSLGISDFRADGVSKREVVVRLDRPAASLPGGAKIKRTLPALGVAIVEVPSGKSPEQIVASLAKAGGVRYADVVRQVEFEVTPGAPGFQADLGLLEEAPAEDPREADQFGLRLIKAREAWQATAGDRGTVLAVVDSGIDITHPELRSQVVGSYNAVTRTSVVRDGRGHGTHTSGIAAASAGNGEGGAGVAPGCGLLAVQISSQGAPGLGDPGRSSDALAAEGVAWAVDRGAKVISMSFGFYRRSKVLEDALQYALDHDVVLVASAGNNHARNDVERAPHLPSTFPGVIEVAAVDKASRQATFSNFGTTVSVTAPGVDVLSSIPGGYQTKSGTSMAAPHVAGVAALVRSRFPDLDRAGVRQRIEASAQDLGERGYDEIFGNGLVDAAAALRL